MPREVFREPQAVELRYGQQLEWAREGERTRKAFALVAIDGYCTRKRAERMFVRVKVGLHDQFWVAPR